LLQRFFGPQLVAAFAEIKAVFDPQGILNPGNLVGAGPVESITERMRIDQAANSLEQFETFYDYRDQDGFAAAVEMCNGAGFCRKTSSGSMCPSYRATLDERHSTRGRGNALRSSIVDGIGGDGSAASPSNGPVWNDPATLETLDLCLSCKACKSECPSSVDIAKLKAEYTAQSHRARGKVPLAARVFGNVRLLNRLGSAMPWLSNWMIRCAPVRRLMNRLLGLAPQRSIPEFAPSLLRWFRRRQKPNADSASSPKVVLFADCFVTFNEPHIGKAAVSVLEKLGYDVRLVDAGCCGRAMISTGLLPQAIRTADQSLARLRPYINDDAVAAIVVCEPSCLSAMKDDWQQLNLTTPIALRIKLAEKAMLVEEFVQKNWDRHPNPPAIAKLTQPMVLHGHCHQKALWGDQTSSAILQRLGAVTVLDAGCCGMAGSFGYLQHRYAVSMKIGELSLFPAVRSAADESLICAPGTSCRHQIKDGAGKQALHPIEVIDRALS
jgi:Fe-S oxidoreductase